MIYSHPVLQTVAAADDLDWVPARQIAAASKGRRERANTVYQTIENT